VPGSGEERTTRGVDGFARGELAVGRADVRWGGKGRASEGAAVLRANCCPWDVFTCARAANGGHLEVLQWARANCCPWNVSTCPNAATGGHLEVLQWLHANGCQWDARTCSSAAEGGHLEVLQWLRANGCPWGMRTCTEAAKGGHLEVLQLARANGCPEQPDVRGGSGGRASRDATVGVQERVPS